MNISRESLISLLETAIMAGQLAPDEEPEVVLEKLLKRIRGEQ